MPHKRHTLSAAALSPEIKGVLFRTAQTVRHAQKLRHWLPPPYESAAMISRALVLFLIISATPAMAQQPAELAPPIVGGYQTADVGDQTDLDCFLGRGLFGSGTAAGRRFFLIGAARGNEK